MFILYAAQMTQSLLCTAVKVPYNGRVSVAVVKSATVDWLLIISTAHMARPVFMDGSNRHRFLDRPTPIAGGRLRSRRRRRDQLTFNDETWLLSPAANLR